jgi:hypothetical protein
MTPGKMHSLWLVHFGALPDGEFGSGPWDRTAERRIVSKLPTPRKATQIRPSPRKSLDWELER